MTCDASRLERLKGVSFFCVLVLSVWILTSRFCVFEFSILFVVFWKLGVGEVRLGHWGLEIAEHFGLIFDQRATETVCGKWVVEIWLGGGGSLTFQCWSSLFQFIFLFFIRKCEAPSYTGLFSFFFCFFGMLSWFAGNEVLMIGNSVRTQRFASLLTDQFNTTVHMSF